jgi:serine/threonine protein kinase
MTMAMSSRASASASSARASQDNPPKDDQPADGSVGEEVPPILNLSDIERLELVGEGATALVYRGMLQGQVVAVKKMDCHPSSMTEKGRINLSRELKILHKVQHCNLVSFYGVAVSGSTLNIVMEYCSGGTAFDLLHNQDSVVMSWVQRWKISMDVAQAMHYLHSFAPQIIHRDLKSLNLLFKDAVVNCEDLPEVKVVDFGQSRMAAVQHGEALDMTKLAGTPHWMAPEVFQTNSYDRKVDVYSYGMILYEVICQEIPFEEVQNKQRLGLLVCSGERPDLKAAPPDCPEEFVALMASCWDGVPAARPDFDEIAASLSKIYLPSGDYGAA